MRAIFTQWLHGFLPEALAAGKHERVRAGLGACLGLFVTALATHMLAPGLAAYLIAPMGASAVLLFCLPASPLAQPWAVVGGNTVSALIGVACAVLVPDALLAAPLAAALAIGAMFALRCLHPPGGAVAVTAVLGGAAVQDVGWWFALAPVGLNSVLMVLGAVVWNKLAGHRYPHEHVAAVAPETRAGFASEDLDAALDTFGETLDVSRDDLAAIFAETEQHAAERRARLHHCGELAHPVPAVLTPDLPLATARGLLVRHGVPALPVVDAL
ncbi:MAG: hypothetical protein JWQ80_523, partial [Massilia sp.]|nr:hypothetical protein [Massilia sp.]